MDIEKEIKEIQELVDMLGSRQDREDFAIISNFIKKQKAKLEKKDKVINEMAKEITEFLGTCPYDKYDWQDIDCEKVCEDDMKQCWEEQQDIDIANIQELKEMTYKEFKKELEFPCITPKEVLLAKINEIIINQNTVIKAVKQLDRKIREER